MTAPEGAEPDIRLVSGHATVEELEAVRLAVAEVLRRGRRTAWAARRRRTWAGDAPAAPDRRAA